MSDDVIVAAVQTGLAQEETALFLTEVNGMTAVPTKDETKAAEKKSRKGTRKAKVAKAEAAVAQENARKLIDEAFAVASKAVDAAPVPAEVAPQTEPFDLEGLLLGNDKPFMDEMLKLRAEGAALFNKGKTVIAESHKAQREAERLTNAACMEAERFIFNTTRKMSESPKPEEKARGIILHATFLDLQKAFQLGSDPVKAGKFAALRSEKVRTDPDLARQHEKNLLAAEKFELESLEKAEAGEAAFAEGRNRFEAANEIAKLYGWPVTEAKKKEEKVTK